jgi:hypothetical protein
MAIVLTPVDTRKLRGIDREIYSRGFLYAIHDRFTGRTLVAQRLRAVAARMNADAYVEDRVSAAQLYEHAAKRVDCLLKHRWRVSRFHLDDDEALANLESLRGGGGSLELVGDRHVYRIE